MIVFGNDDWISFLDRVVCLFRNCEDFDLCEFCESQRTHDEEHIFLKVRKPCPNIGLDKNGRKKAIIKKNQYLKSEAACG